MHFGFKFRREALSFRHQGILYRIFSLCAIVSAPYFSLPPPGLVMCTRVSGMPTTARAKGLCPGWIGESDIVGSGRKDYRTDTGSMCGASVEQTMPKYVHNNTIDTLIACRPFSV